jgi:hypothetical protein
MRFRGGITGCGNAEGNTAVGTSKSGAVSETVSQSSGFFAYYRAEIEVFDDMGEISR